MDLKPFGKFLAILALTATLSPWARATTTYNYTGNAFNLFQEGETCPSDCEITASITLPAPLADNLVYQTITPIAYSITDGNISLDNTNSTPVFVGFGYYSTDASGDITTWGFEVESDAVNGPLLLTINVPEYSVVTDQRADYEVSISYWQNNAYNENDPGTWTLSSVPEPSSFVLFGCGLLLTLCVARRKTAKLG